jgi:hypothetical protein
MLMQPGFVKWLAYVNNKSIMSISRGPHVSVRSRCLSLVRDVVSDSDTGVHLLRLGLLGGNVVCLWPWFG